jgi:hypothetical protein
MSVDTDILGRSLAAWLEWGGKPILFQDRATGATHTLPFSSVRDPAGLLPVFAVAGEAVWREATGRLFALDICRDDAALFGRSLHAVGGGTYSALMLSMMEAVSQAAGPRTLLINDLRVQWAASIERAPALHRPPPAGPPGPAP